MSAVSSMWWFETGTDRCEFCLQRTAWEVEIRCVACDRPACPLCAVHIHARREVVCPECVAGDANRAEGT